MIQLCNNAHKSICINASRPALIPVVGCENKFCAPDQIGKTKRSGSVVPGSFKIFQNSFESLGFIHIYHALKQQVNQSY